MTRYAIIDLGSNSVRMNIMQVEDNGSYYLLDQAKEMVRLSEGMGEERILKEEPIQRTINALQLFMQLIDAYKIENVYALATAAVRMATNQKDFLEQVKAEIGLTFQVLSGEQEAYYDYFGVINTIDLQEGLIVDIGGGSTELIWFEDRVVRSAVSLPFGSVVLTETFDQTKKSGVQDAMKYVRKHLEDLKWIRHLRGLPVVGLGGVIRTAAKVDRNAHQFPVMTLHNYRLTQADAQSFFQMIEDASVKELRSVQGINKRRADIMKGGVLPIRLIMDMLEADQLVISGNGLRDGYFLERYMENHGVEQSLVQDILDHSIENLVKRYSFNMPHALHVRKLTLALFDGLKPIHGFRSYHRRLLHVASFLHDVGNHVDYYNHHMHGFYLTLNSRINGLTNPELISCAYLVGMHRTDKLKVDMKPYEVAVSQREFDRLQDLSILLGISEKLDRSESGTITDVDVAVSKKEALVTVYADEEPVLELMAAQEYGDKFESAFGCPVRLVYGGISK